MANAFLSPKEAKRKSHEHVAKAAEQINTLLASGARVFNVAKGIAQAVAAEIRGANDPGEPGWTVNVYGCADTAQDPNASKNMMTIVIIDPSEPEPS